MSSIGTKQTFELASALEHDKPSSFFSQYGDERITEVGYYLDVALEVALRKAAQAVSKCKYGTAVTRR